MDIATLAGLIFGIIVVCLAAVSGGDVGAFVNLPGLTIVAGGTIAATLIKFSLKDCFKSFGMALKTAFFDRVDKPAELIREAETLAAIAKRKGPLALDGHPVQNPLFQKGIQLIADGQPADFIEKVIRHEIELSIERFEVGERIFRAMGEAAPAFGLIGTLVGLVQMLSNMKDADSLGPAMAIALLTTLYGALIANLIANPIADKLDMRGKQERNCKELIIDSILSIQQGLNPRVMAELLEAYVPATERSDASEVGSAA